MGRKQVNVVLVGILDVLEYVRGGCSVFYFSCSEVTLHHQTLRSTLLHLLLQLGMSRSSMSSNLFGHY